MSIEDLQSKLVSTVCLCCKHIAIATQSNVLLPERIQHKYQNAPHGIHIYHMVLFCVGNTSESTKPHVQTKKKKEKKKKKKKNEKRKKGKTKERERERRDKGKRGEREREGD